MHKIIHFLYHRGHGKIQTTDKHRLTQVFICFISLVLSMFTSIHLWLILCVLCVLRGENSLALAQDGPARAQEPRKIIYVPREEFMRVIDPARRGRVIEFKEYMRLERLAARVRAGLGRIEPAAPIAAVFTSAHYHGIVGESLDYGQVAMFARYEFSTLVRG